MAEYEFFRKEFEFRGKHARMVSELWVLNDYTHTYFKRLIDVYILASIVGIRMDRKAEEDYSPIEPRSIFPEQMLKAKEDLDFIMQMMIILDNKNSMSNEACVDKAFRGATTKEEYEYYKNMFENYVRGGVEELYEQLIIRKADIDDLFHDEKTASIMALVEKMEPNLS